MSDTLPTTRGIAPEFVPCDNGPELTANALHDWCVGSRSPAPATSITVPEPVGRVVRVPHARRLFTIEQFDSVREAQVLIADWRDEYNNYRPHSALGMLTPAEFTARSRTEHQPQLT